MRWWECKLIARRAIRVFKFRERRLHSEFHRPLSLRHQRPHSKDHRFPTRHSSRPRHSPDRHRYHVGVAALNLITKKTRISQPVRFAAVRIFFSSRPARLTGCATWKTGHSAFFTMNLNCLTPKYVNALWRRCNETRSAVSKLAMSHGKSSGCSFPFGKLRHKFIVLGMVFMRNESRLRTMKQRRDTGLKRCWKGQCLEVKNNGSRKMCPTKRM